MKMFSPWVKGFMAQFLCATVVIVLVVLLVIVL